MKKPTFSIILDTRKMKKNGLYTLKFLLYIPNKNIRKYYPTSYEFNKEDFKCLMSNKPTKVLKDTRKELNTILSRGCDIIENMKSFDLLKFSNIFLDNNNSKEDDVIKLFELVKKEKLLNNAFSTSNKYEQTKNLLVNFMKISLPKNSILEFGNIDHDFLQKFENYLKREKKHSNATIGINLRNIRYVYNLAIEKGVIDKELYPFGFKKYSIPKSKKVNKALSKSDLKKLLESKPKTEEQSIAKDFWFFSYFSYGMNTVDICKLKENDIINDCFTYVRTKTSTTKKEVKSNKVKLTTNHYEIIDRRRDNSSKYLFGILKKEMTLLEIHNKVRNFNRFVVKHFRKYALEVGIDPNFANQLGTYHARHSFASIASKHGASPKDIQDIFGHQDLETTQSYINDLNDSGYEEINNMIKL
jgi:integrase/recombinase XerD